MSTEALPESPIFAIATLQACASDRIVFSQPHELSSVKAEAPEASAVFAISRFHSLNQTWIQIAGHGDNDEVIYGWMKPDCINSIQLVDRTILPSELPLSRLELNTREEISWLINIVRRENKKKGSFEDHIALLDTLRSNDSRKAFERLSVAEKSTRTLQLANKNAQRILSGDNKAADKDYVRELEALATLRSDLVRTTFVLTVLISALILAAIAVWAQRENLSGETLTLILEYVGVWCVYATNLLLIARSPLSAGCAGKEFFFVVLGGFVVAGAMYILWLVVGYLVARLNKSPIRTPRLFEYELR